MFVFTDQVGYIIHRSKPDQILELTHLGPFNFKLQLSLLLSQQDILPGFDPGGGLGFPDLEDVALSWRSWRSKEDFEPLQVWPLTLDPITLGDNNQHSVFGSVSSMSRKAPLQIQCTTQLGLDRGRCQVVIRSLCECVCVCYVCPRSDYSFSTNRPVSLSLTHFFSQRQTDELPASHTMHILTTWWLVSTIDYGLLLLPNESSIKLWDFHQLFVYTSTGDWSPCVCV